MSRTREALPALLLALALAACTSGGGGDGGAAGDPEAEPAEGSAVPRIDAPGVEGEVALLGPPEQGAGEVPIFEWQAVEGAATYRLAALDEDGGVVWAWEGEGTSVPLGGVADRPEGEPGPVLEGAGSWSVVAVDREGRVLAVSEIRSVAP